ncbi:hypothetical protein PHYBLDRAFT_176356 [Phycomyces blakesleeanus NRRL 1555(-)]|uniref:Uncharacterized protein n=1 Tax=Phycomyces blakesleeanus (strain ATCC 8743b / DSM 1359 / FGSC 10004 / NBRC 33097 / NRRL 1555) TaxID=763407 RepID=A0A162PFD3_PHYB8|nr:hypothetical protein PHYBLDRAFT_176356 [Phycomyces blakesleeanus NRRL 1555(-)]OAD65166.1 hypothetical protein PHYBLDRAFT_176356 [Phycomyces blakesleeanus NRRL 1555(-)]|eukprot:XP_018283206.1 hypothetical protein PHYBLDRAFT_176356 [Phycomyces blakesleeanus NRRL 1555(-)]
MLLGKSESIQKELLGSDIFFKRQKICRKCQYKKTVAYGHGESVSEKNCVSSLFVVTFPTKFLTLKSAVFQFNSRGREILRLESTSLMASQGRSRREGRKFCTKSPIITIDPKKKAGEKEPVEDQPVEEYDWELLD